METMKPVMNPKTIINSILVSLPLWGCIYAAYYYLSRPVIIPFETTSFVMQGVEETSPLVINGQVVIMGSARDDKVIGTKLVFKTLDGNMLAEVPTDIACASATVNPNGTINVIGVRNADKPGDKIIRLTLNDRFEIVEEKQIYENGSQLIYNVSEVNGIISYEVANDTSGHPRIYFSNGRDVLAIFDNLGHYATTPTLKKLGDWYYLFFTANRRINKNTYQNYSAVTRTQDFKSFAKPRELLSKPGTCACDPDLVEFQGKTYLSYDEGSQQNGTMAESTHVAVYNGTLENLLEQLF